jgi:hypothetical protein
VTPRARQSLPLLPPNNAQIDSLCTKLTLDAPNRSKYSLIAPITTSQNLEVNPATTGTAARWVDNPSEHVHQHRHLGRSLRRRLSPPIHRSLDLKPFSYRPNLNHSCHSDPVPGSHHRHCSPWQVLCGHHHPTAMLHLHLLGMHVLRTQINKFGMLSYCILVLYLR